MDGQMDVRDTTREVVQRYKEREASSGYSSSERDLPIWSLILFMLFVNLYLFYNAIITGINLLVSGYITSLCVVACSEFW